MAEVVRVAALTGYLDTMETFGVDPRPLLREHGLSADMLLNPEQFISAIAATRLLEASARVTGCVTLGLRMAESRSIANLGASSLLIAHQPTLRQALETLREFRARINSTLVLHFEEHGDEAIIREDFQLSSPEPTRQSSELVLGVLTRLCSAILGARWSPRLVCFTHEAPPPSELPVYSRMFGCRAQFDSEFNGLVVARSDLDRPNTRADPQLALHARHLLEASLSPGERTTAQDVEHLIKLFLPSGRATVQVCAASMGLTVRTLQRQLDAERTSFSALLTRARMQLATQYLANPRMRVTDVADMLGYSSIGAFTRWHTAAFGRPPRESRPNRSAAGAVFSNRLPKNL